MTSNISRVRFFFGANSSYYGIVQCPYRLKTIIMNFAVRRGDMKPNIRASVAVTSGTVIS